MALVAMVAFSEPSLRSRSIIASDVAPAIRGEGPNDYACGGCGVVLASSIHVGQLQFLGFRCPDCGVFSEPAPEVAVVPDLGGLRFPVGIYRVSDTIVLHGPAARAALRGERSN